MNAAQIIAFPGVKLPPKPKRRRPTKADYDAMLLFEAGQISKHLRKCLDALDQRIEELQSQKGACRD